MRLLFPVAIAFAATASAAPVSQRPSPLKSNDCPSAASHFAGKGGLSRGDPAKPKKLTQLPPADAFAAVYLTDERGCMVPVKYRDVRR
jgi:hypothetical protein